MNIHNRLNVSVERVADRLDGEKPRPAEARLGMQHAIKPKCRA
jgi:hypothetical protein